MGGEPCKAAWSEEEAIGWREGTRGWRGGQLLKRARSKIEERGSYGYSYSYSYIYGYSYGYSYSYVYDYGV